MKGKWTQLVSAVLVLAGLAACVSQMGGGSDGSSSPVVDRPSLSLITPATPSPLSTAPGVSSTSGKPAPARSIPSRLATSPQTQPSPVGRDRAAAWPVPDNHLTPGAVSALCPKERDVSTALKNLVKARYGIVGPVGEYDHRIPKSACGADESACPAKPDATCAAAQDNIWPERADGYDPGGFFHNRKDQLEIYAAQHHFSIGMVINMFAAPSDWRHWWCHYLGPTNPQVDCSGV